MERERSLPVTGLDHASGQKSADAIGAESRLTQMADGNGPSPLKMIRAVS
jgi:hypothetical protein